LSYPNAKEEPTMSEMTSAQKDKLVADLRTVVADAEELLKLTAGDLSESTVSLRERLTDRLARARHSLLDLQDSAAERAKAAGRAADDYVHDHPWTAIGIGAGIGLLVGLLIGRR
jgi:ElaB/YqjD/DUF883 family membrane-anchored ribosome-binding protein